MSRPELTRNADGERCREITRPQVSGSILIRKRPTENSNQRRNHLRPEPSIIAWGLRSVQRRKGRRSIESLTTQTDKTVDAFSQRAEAFQPLRVLRQAVRNSRGAFNWGGLLTGFPAISMLVIGLYQGDRLDWLNSPLICVMLGGGGLLFCLFLLNEWSHPLPFFKLRMLAQRNFTHSLITLAGVLVVLLGVAVIPSDYLIEVRGYRPLQIAPLALAVALPQLIALPVTAAILNISRVDCRWVLGLGLTLVAASCALGSFMTSDWVRENFYLLPALLTMRGP